MQSGKVGGWGAVIAAILAVVVVVGVAVAYVKVLGGRTAESPKAAAGQAILRSFAPDMTGRSGGAAQASGQALMRSMAPGGSK